MRRIVLTKLQNGICFFFQMNVGDSCEINDANVFIKISHYSNVYHSC